MTNASDAPQIITYTFPKCWVHVDEAGSFLHTAFESGRILESVMDPQKDIATAREYGYADNIWRLWREHDILHHTIGTLFGYGVSPTIWSVAHEDHPEALPLWARHREEGFIAHVHRWLNLNLWDDELCALGNFGLSFEEMQTHLRQILAGTTLEVVELSPSQV